MRAGANFRFLAICCRISLGEHYLKKKPQKTLLLRMYIMKKYIVVVSIVTGNKRLESI